MARSRRGRNRKAHSLRTRPRDETLFRLQKRKRDWERLALGRESGRFFTEPSTWSRRTASLIECAIVRSGPNGCAWPGILEPKAGPAKTRTLSWRKTSHRDPKRIAPPGT